MVELMVVLRLDQLAGVVELVEMKPMHQMGLVLEAMERWGLGAAAEAAVPIVLVVEEVEMELLFTDIEQDKNANTN